MLLPIFAVLADLYVFRRGSPPFQHVELHLEFIARFRHTQRGDT